jgi:hypothetical protein
MYVHRTFAHILALTAGTLLLPTKGLFAADNNTPPPTPMPGVAITLIMIAIVSAVTGSVILIGVRLKQSGWSLRDALTEPSVPGTGGAPPIGASSSSRLIALLGMVVILILFVGVGLVAVWQFAENNRVDLSQFQNYFLAGASLFIPYVMNQVRNIGK